ncbi:MAG: hypothetical protein RLZ98_1641 [Pseudomonadota bacterium]|jgi:TctA family transporter
MEVEAALHALVILFDPMRLAILALGVFIGLIIGVIPGIGGLVGLALTLPFTITMDPYTALAFLIGLSSVTNTSDSIPAVLFGVPGTVGSAATTMDGFPLSKRGEAGRALGAAFSASVLGGVFGALLLGLSIPVLRPFMLSIGSPDLLAVCTLGLTLVASLSGKNILKGLVAACIGIFLSQVGDEGQTGIIRWSGDSLYLLEGFPLVPVALAMFAVPELIDLAVSRTSVSSSNAAASGNSWQQVQGVRDTFKHWWLVLKCSWIGAFLGSIPGIGASIIDWIAYGYAARTLKGAEKTFGTGDIRGVIASESSNNAKEGGALVPTIAFGVPGSAAMALLLGAFLMHGIEPGPKMLTEKLDVTYTMVWSVAIANLMGAGTCFLFANQFAKLALVRAGILVPLVMTITFVGAYQGSRDSNDFIVLVTIGVIAWLMKRQGWPRPPVILGFILGDLIEDYMFISYNAYQFSFLLHPGVLFFGALTLAVLFWPLIAALTSREKTLREPPPERSIEAHILGRTMWALAACVFVFMLATSWNWPFAARLLPQVVAIAGLLFVLVRIVKWRIDMMPIPADQLATEIKRDHMREDDALAELDNRELIKRSVIQLAYLGLLLALILLIGMLPAAAIYVPLVLILEGKVPLWKSLVMTAVLIAATYVVFDVLLHMPWPDSLIGDLYPELRNFRGLRIL